MFLATTALTDFWNVQDEVLLLGPWCVPSGRQDALKGLRVRRLPNIWDDRARLGEASRYCLGLQQGLLAALTGYLNAAHGTRLSGRYWRILLGPWLLHYTHQLFDRQAQLARAFEEFPEARSILLAEEDFRAPRDCRELERFYPTDRYNLQIYSHILRGWGKPFPARRIADGVPAPGPAPESAKRRVILSAARALGWTARRRGLDLVTDELYPTGRLLWRILWALRGRAAPLLDQFPPSLRMDPVMDERRRGLAGLPAGDPFLRLLVSSLPHQLPAIFLEGFARARGAAGAARGRRPRAVFVGTGHYFNDRLKFAAADWVERGAQLWGYQHGGMYGMSRHVVGEWHERQVSDRYFTWGWSGLSRDPRVGDLPVPKLSQLASRKRRKPGQELLLLSTDSIKNAHGLIGTPLGWQWEDHFAQRESFIAALGPLFDSLLLRLPPHDYGWSQEARLRARFPALRLDSHAKELHARALGSRLTVTDHPGTAMLEVLALDVPSVHYWRPDRWEMRPEAQPFLDALRKAGIVHEDPDSAAAHARAVYPDPLPWWTSPETRSARLAFAETFALTRPNWLDAWRERIVGELDRLPCVDS